MKITIDGYIGLCYTILNSTRRASDRKVKQAGLEFKLFFCYIINNIPATLLVERLSAFWAGINLKYLTAEFKKIIIYLTVPARRKPRRVCFLGGSSE